MVLTEKYTGLLGIENAMTLARRNYWAELTEILHGTLQGDSAWDSLGVIGNMFWGPRYGAPKDTWGWANFFEQYPYLGPKTEISKNPRLSHVKFPRTAPYKISVNSAQ